MKSSGSSANWDDYKFFAAIRKGRTLRAAATALGTDQATVGRRLRALEERLGTKLFEKRSDGYFPSDAGERIWEGVERIEKEFDEIDRKVAGKDDRLEGTIRIALPGALASHFLIPRLKAFAQAHPKVNLQFLTGYQVVNLAKRDADLAIRLVRPSQAGLQLKKIGTLKLALYGSRELLKKGAPIKKIADLSSYAFIGLDPEATSDMESGILDGIREHLRYSMVSHSWESVYSAVEAGIGIGTLPSFMTGKASSSIEQVALPIESSCPIWLAYHADLKGNARVRALIAEIEKIF